MTQILRGITLRAPWVYAILALGKRVENRTWHPRKAGGRVGMTLAIHGGVFTNTAAYRIEIWEAFSAMRRVGAITPQQFPPDLTPIDARGRAALTKYAPSGIVAVATLTAVTAHSTSPWAVPGQQHWMLEDVVTLEHPVAHRGAQGLWTVQADALAQIEAQTGRSWA